MARRGFVALGLLIICVIVMLFFKRKTKEGFLNGNWKNSCSSISNETSIRANASCRDGAGTYVSTSISNCMSGTAENCFGILTCGTCSAPQALGCTAGKYISNGTCTNCPTNTYSLGGSSTSCTNCGANSTSTAGSTSASNCRCNAGYYGTNGACLLCPSGKTSVAGTTTVAGCMASSCPSGYYLSSGSCLICGANTYGGGGTATSCTNCGLNSTSTGGSTSVSACICKANFYGTNGSCAACPTNSTSIAGSTTQSACRCAANSYMNNGQCTTCPTNSTSIAGSTTQSDCRCAANSYMNNGQCTTCPTGLTSPAGSTSQAACACPAGQRSVTLNGVTKCVTDCPTMTKPPRTQGSDQALLFALANCAAKTFNYNNNGVMQTTNPCVNSFYDFDLQKCVNALGTNVGLGSSTPCSSSTVYSSATNACVPVRVIVKPGDPQLINTTGSPSQGDFRDCKTVDQGDCTILFKDPLGNSLTANPCAGNNQLYNFATKTCIAKTKKCCNYTDPLKAAADKSCAADTNLFITKNTALCPATSRTLCCNNAYATNTTCIKNNFWRPSYAFTTANRTKCASGFQDYQGVHLLNKKMAKMNRLV